MKKYCKKFVRKEILNSENLSTEYYKKQENMKILNSSVGYLRLTGNHYPGIKVLQKVAEKKVHRRLN